MKHLMTLLYSVLFTVVLSAQNPLVALLPMPNDVQRQAGKPFLLTDRMTIYISSPDLTFAASQLQNVLKERTGLSVPVSTHPNSAIRLTTDETIEGEEHYRLNVDRKSLSVSGATPGAVLYGVMTLDQILLGDVVSSSAQTIAPIRIDDTPRYNHRALMLDPARHFLPVADVKFFIDQMVRYKYNVLQLHLTDDQGWRIEIKKHPRLTETGAYYTQEELKEIIRYAAERHVEVVPELDIPGHTVAVLAVYPDLGCTSADTVVKEVSKTTNLMLCADRERAYQLYDDVIAEVAALFPSSQIHLGGDEAAIAHNWAVCERCRALVKKLGYQKPEQLMNYFFGRILASVRRCGKKPILWCELDRIYAPANEYLFDYPQDVTLVTWRNGLTPKCIELTAQHGNPLIMAPGEYLYFDYPQGKNDFPEFNNWGMPTTTLEKTYQFDPGYGLPQEQQAHIIGVMGTLWGEAIKDIHRATYMTFPRGLALAEAGWTQMSHRSWDSFKERMYPNLTNLMKHGVSVRVPYEVGKKNDPTLKVEPLMK